MKSVVNDRLTSISYHGLHGWHGLSLAPSSFYIGLAVSMATLITSVIASLFWLHGRFRIRRKNV